MINKVEIIEKRLKFLYEIVDDIYMNIKINNDLEYPVEENNKELHSTLADIQSRIYALQKELDKVLKE